MEFVISLLYEFCHHYNNFNGHNRGINRFIASVNTFLLLSNMSKLEVV